MMEFMLPIAVAVLVSAFGLGFYMDWFGLWMSKAEVSEQQGAAKTRMLEANQKERGQE